MQKSYTIKGPRGESSPGPPSHFCAWGGGGGGFDLINQALGFDLGRKKHLLSQEELQLATLAFVKRETLKMSLQKKDGNTRTATSFPIFETSPPRSSAKKAPSGSHICHW